MAMCGTCCIMGRIQTLLIDEEPDKCMEMGTVGNSLCLCAIPIKLLEPLGGCLWFIINSCRIRRQLSDKHNLKNVTKCCCGISVALPCAGCNFFY